MGMVAPHMPLPATSGDPADCDAQHYGGAPPHTFYGNPAIQGACPLVAWGCEFDLVIYGTKSLLFKENMGLHEALGAI